jgi:hypothetical protein
MVSPTVQGTRTEEDFVKHIQKTIATDPQVAVHSLRGLPTAKKRGTWRSCEKADWVM